MINPINSINSINPEEFKNINKIIFSSPFDKSESKLTGRKIKIKNQDYIQFEYIANNQAFHQNISLGDVYCFFSEKISKYKQADIYFSDFHYIAFNKNSEISFHKTKDKNINPDLSLSEHEHNLRKNYIINEGDNIPALIELGIFTKDLKVVNSMYNKFKQINRFVELFDDMSGKIDEIYKKRNKINLIDFGCGKSYLTFILYHYFTRVKKFPENALNIVGVDLKKSVIDNCNSLAKKYGYKNLAFETGDINGYNPEFPPDNGVNIVVSLHGCDTATDYALYNAIKWQSDIIFAAPCCEHEINAQINAKSLNSAHLGYMRNILKYGAAKERFSALLTNSVRCSILELQNYKTELIEFVDISHSPKNLLIRAAKINGGSDKLNNLNNLNKLEIKKELDETLQNFNINQTLYNLLDLLDILDI